MSISFGVLILIIEDLIVAFESLVYLVCSHLSARIGILHWEDDQKVEVGLVMSHELYAKSRLHVIGKVGLEQAKDSLILFNFLTYSSPPSIYFSVCSYLICILFIRS